MSENSPETHYSHLFFNKNLQVIYSVTLIAVMGVASITPAFPRIIGYFNISSHQIGLLITVFTFPGIILAPVFGILADRLGRKKILIPSLFLFGISGFSCAFISDFNLLLLMRTIQGMGAASLGALNVTLIGDLFTGKDRSAAMGYNASVLSIGTASYPAIGGALALFGWNYPFILPVLAIPVGLLVIFGLNNPEPKRSQSFNDYLSSILKSVRKKQVLILFILSIITFILIYGSYLTYYPLLISFKFKASSLVIGIIMSVMSVSTALTSSQLGKLTKKYSEKHLIKVAFILYTLALFSIPYLSNIYLLLIPTIIFGIAQGLNLPGIQTLLAGLAPIEHRAAFMSINGMVLRLGQTIGPLLIGVFFSIWGIDAAYFSGAGLAFITFILTIFLL
ncbi:MAG: MFS transporter [Calditrichaceae bacterium]